MSNGPHHSTFQQDTISTLNILTDPIQLLNLLKMQLSLVALKTTDELTLTQSFQTPTDITQVPNSCSKQSALGTLSFILLFDFFFSKHLFLPQLGERTTKYIEKARQ